MAAAVAAPPVIRASALCACRFIVWSTEARPVRFGPCPLNSGTSASCSLATTFGASSRPCQNAKLRLVVRLGVLECIRDRRRVESGDRCRAVVLDQHARGRAIHRRRREGAHGDGEQDQEKHRDDDVAVFVDGVEAIEKVRVGIGRKETFADGTGAAPSPVRGWRVSRSGPSLNRNYRQYVTIPQRR